MMGGGVCWLDYNNDGWMDLFAVNSYTDANVPQWLKHGGFPRSALYENVEGQVRQRQPQVGRRPRGPRQRLRRRRLQRRRLHRSLRLDGGRRQAALEQRQRHVHPGRAAGRRRLVRLACGRGRRGREWRRAARPLRRGLHQPEPADPELGFRLPDEPRRSARSALPERGQRPERAGEVPRGRHPGGPRARALRARPGRRVHRRQRRRPSRSLRRERRGSEPPLHQRPAAGAKDGGSTSTSSSAARQRAWTTGTPAWASRPATTTATGRPTCS